MVHIILVHGMNATAESWNTVPQGLEDGADSVTAVQLPGHDVPMTFEELAAFGLYNAGYGMDHYVEVVVNAFPPGGGRNVCLIGHSMGGAVISHVAAQYHERISKLIYVAAMLPGQGQSAQDMLNAIKADPAFSPAGFISDFMPHLAEISLVRQPAEPLSARFKRTPDFEALRRGHIRCARDHVIPVSAQDRMINAYGGANPPTDIRTLNLSHLPQYDDADSLVGIIQELLP